MKKLFLLFTILVWAQVLTATGAGEPLPNFVLIFCDDLGYGDLGCYGSQKNLTPRIDELAKSGKRFTSFYSSSPVCTPSRSSLMTGCYPRRIGMHEDFTGHWVLIPRSRRGLNPDEVTVAEALKEKGYATACIGKWHLGDQPEHLPTQHGFDFYFGIPYSNDMQTRRRGDPPLPLVEQERVIEAPANQATLTKRYTEQAVKFIESNKSRPFFLYLPHTFPHLPLFAPKEFHGKSANGRYGDSVEEIDWSTGQIVDCLKRNGLSENTLIIFTSDNGSNGRNGGSNEPLSGAKGSTMEGGMRVPMIAQWPGQVPAGSTCSAIATTMDVLPTFCSLASAPMPERRIDGHNITDLLTEKGDRISPYKEMLYYRRRQLQAIRAGDWKYHLPLENIHPNWTSADQTRPGRKGKLVNLATDLQETKDVSAEHPKIVRKMNELAANAIARLGTDEITGSEQRPARTLESSTPMLLGGNYEIEPVSDAVAAEYKLDASFYKKCTRVQDILIATSATVNDLAHLEAAYQFDMIMSSINPQVAQRIRDKGVLCILIGHDEFTSDLPQFKTTKTGKELDFYNWRQRGFLTHKLGRPTVVFAEEDVLEYEGGMRLESILVHEFGHVIHGAGFDEALQQRLTETFQRARAKGIWMDGRAAQRFRRIKSETPVSLLEALVKWFPNISADLLTKCLDGGDILVNGKPTNSDVNVTKDDEVLIVFGGQKECYAHKNRSEYWAEILQCWYDTNRTMDHDHNHIHTREQLKAYDPVGAELCKDILGNTAWRFVSPRERAGKGHLKSFDPTKSPKVVDPLHIETAAYDYYDKYWKSYWQRLRDKHK